MAIYQQQIRDHYLQPLHTEVLEWFTHTAKVSNLICGDEVTIFLDVENGTIKNISHQSEGCAVVIATASILSDYLIGKNIDQISDLNLAKLSQMIGFIPGAAREGCVLITLGAIQKALTTPTNKSV